MEIATVIVVIVPFLLGGLRLLPILEKQRVRVLGGVGDARASTALFRYDDFTSNVDAGAVVAAFTVYQRGNVRMECQISRAAEVSEIRPLIRAPILAFGDRGQQQNGDVL